MSRFITAGLAVALALVAGAAAAQTTYTFTGGNYTSVRNAGACTVGECATYTTSMRYVATLTFDQPLPANMARADVSALIRRYTFSDGVTTTSGPGDIASLDGVEIATNAQGAVSDYAIGFQRTPGPPYLVNQPSQANSRFSFGALFPTFSVGNANTVSPQRGPRQGAAVTGPGHSIDRTLDGQESSAFSNLPTTVTVVTVEPVPTLSEWAMMLFGGLLAAGAAVVVARRRAV